MVRNYWFYEKKKIGFIFSLKADLASMCKIKKKHFCFVLFTANEI